MKNIPLRFILLEFHLLLNIIRGEINFMPELPVITVDRPSHRYWVGEEAVFSITSAENRKVDVKFLTDDRQILHWQQVTLQPGIASKLKFGLQSPGFLRCRVAVFSDSGEETMQCVVAFEPERIPIRMPERGDFQLFWNNAVEKLHAIPADFKLIPDPSMAIHDFDFYRVSAANINDSRIYGFLSIPKRMYEPVPLVVTLAGYGPGFSAASMWARREFLGVWQESVCTLCLNVHDFEPADKPAELKRIYDEFCTKNNNYHYYMSGMENPESSYLLRGILGCLRLTELVAALPCVNPKRIVWAGSGQGGDFGLYLCHLSDLFSAAMIGVPGFCNLDGESPVFGGLPEFQKYTEQQRLFDGVHHASRIKIPVLMTVGYTNETNYPSSAYPVLHALKGERVVLDLTGGSSADNGTSHIRLVRTWLRDSLGLYTK